MSKVMNCLIALGLFLSQAGTAASNDAVKPGVLEGHLKIVLPKTVELADGNAATLPVESYPEYPLIILKADGKKEVARVTADKDGKYQVVLPPGDYVLDVQGRGRGHVRAKPQPFKVVSHQIIRVDMDIDTGVR